MDDEGEEVVAVERKEVEEVERPTLPTYPLIRFTDLPENTKPEIIDFVSGAVERYIDNLEEACKSIKEEMDRLYGTFWHVAAGENFGYDVTYETTNILYMFVGSCAVVVWKHR